MACARECGELRAYQVLPPTAVQAGLAGGGFLSTGIQTVDEAVRAGKQLGAAYVVYGAWSGVGGSKGTGYRAKATLASELDTHRASLRIQLQLVRVANGQVVKSLLADGRSPSHASSPQDALAAALEDAVEALGKKLER